MIGIWSSGAVAGLCWDWRFMTAPVRSRDFLNFPNMSKFQFWFFDFRNMSNFQSRFKPSAVWATSVEQKNRRSHRAFQRAQTFDNLVIKVPLLLLLHLGECFVSPGTRPDSSALTSPSYSHATGNVFSFFPKKEMIKHFLFKRHDVNSHCGAWICVAL